MPLVIVLTVVLLVSLAVAGAACADIVRLKRVSKMSQTVLSAPAAREAGKLGEL